MQFTPQEMAILDDLSVQDAFGSLDFVEKLIFYNLYMQQLSIRETANAIHLSHVAILKRLKTMRIKIGYHIQC